MSSMPNAKIYIHEHNDITLQNRAKYIEHMTAGWGTTIRPERNMLCFGVWATVGSTERWPEVMNIWEFESLPHIAENFRIEFNNPLHQDPTLVAWWSQAANYRSGGYDRLLVGASYSPSIDELIARGVRPEVYYHECVQTAPGQAQTYLDLVQSHWLPVAASLRLELIGAFRTLMVNDSEVILVWGMPDWDAWADLEIAYESDPRVAAWRAQTRGIALDWRNKLMVPAPLHPLVTGKQPGT
jgi:hypothetical protein